jgi:LysM repeat protein
MARSNPADVIDSYRRRKEHASLFTFADISKAILFLIMLASSLYVVFTGGPELPTLVELNTNTPTFTPSITPTTSPTATITMTPTETPDPDNQCDCPPAEVLVVTATLGAKDTPSQVGDSIKTATIAFTPTATFPPTETLTPTASATPTPTQIIYTVQNRDTLGGIALRFGVTVEAIQTLNNLDSTMIYEGQVLQIPQP